MRDFSILANNTSITINKKEKIYIYTRNDICMAQTSNNYYTSTCAHGFFSSFLKIIRIKFKACLLVREREREREREIKLARTASKDGHTN